MTLEVAKSIENQVKRQGNEWRFDEANTMLRPGLYPHVITDLDSLPTLDNFVRGVTLYYVDHYSWKFKALLAGSHPDRHFVLVYTNPERNELKRTDAGYVPDLVTQRERQIMDTSPYLRDEQINHLLKGTNLVVNNASASYNKFVVMEPRGLIKKEFTPLEYIQMGVGFIMLNLGPIENRIATVDSEIEIIKLEANEKLGKKFKEREKFDRQKVENPLKLL